MASDAELIEQSLLHLAESGIEIRHALYQRFVEAFPHRKPAFFTPQATTIRMTDETLQMLYGLAAEEDWVWTLIAELVETHRSYGRLPIAEFDAWVDMTVEEVGAALPGHWNAETAAAWQRQTERLKAMIAKAQAEWDRILPQTQFA